INQVSVRFSDPVTGTGRPLGGTDLDLGGRAVSAFAYDPATLTATWTLSQPLGSGRLTLGLDGDGGVTGTDGLLLDGEWDHAQGFPSGDGTAGGAFVFRFNVLPGDVNGDGRVLADDFSAVKRRSFSSITNPGTGAAAYSIFHDIDGSGSILANDFSAAKARFFNTLPGGEPASAFAPGAPRPRRPPRASLSPLG